MEYNVPGNDSIENWYQLFKDGQQEESKEQPVATKGTLGDLIIYVTQAKACSELVASIMNELNLAITSDIINDEVIEFRPTIANAPEGVPTPSPAAPQVMTPLSTIVLNRDKIVKASERLNTVVKAIDSILARVKIKES